MSQRTMPARKDNWRPVDRIYDGILERCVDEAERGARRDGTAELMAGGVVIAVLAVGILVVVQSAAAALLVCGVLAVGLFWFIVGTAQHADTDRLTVLAEIGGAGMLPAGYLVHPVAWKAGMAEYVAHLPESQLKAGAEMCHVFPGTVTDLITFVGNIAIHVPLPHKATPGDVEKRGRELVRIGLPILKKHVKTVPALPKA
jgi:hypothetical protein